MGNIIIPSYHGGFARYAGESEYPDQWRGLIAAWPFFLGPTGGTVHDIMRGNLGELTNMDPATDWVATVDKWGNPIYALDFDGTNDYVDMGNKDIFSFGNGAADTPFSICAWVYYRGTGGNGPAYPIVSKYRENTPVFDGEYSFLINPSDKLILQILDSRSTDRCRQDSDNTITKNQWTFLCATYDASGVDEGIKLYQDGLLMSSTGLGQDGAYVAMHNRTSELTIGNSLDEATPPDYSGFADGLISDICISNVALSAGEILERYENQYGLYIPRRWVSGYVAPAAANLLLLPNNLRGNLQDLRGGLI